MRANIMITSKDVAIYHRRYRRRLRHILMVISFIILSDGKYFLLIESFSQSAVTFISNISEKGEDFKRQNLYFKIKNTAFDALCSAIVIICLLRLIWFLGLMILLKMIESPKERIYRL